MPLATDRTPMPEFEINEAQALDQAQILLKFVAVSREMFPHMRELADHPGWQILLELFVAARQAREMTADEICRITGSWRPLGMRYIDLLCQQGTVERDLDILNRDNSRLTLSPETDNRLAQMLSGFAQRWPGID